MDITINNPFSLTIMTYVDATPALLSELQAALKGADPADDANIVEKVIKGHVFDDCLGGHIDSKPQDLALILCKNALAFVNWWEIAVHVDTLSARSQSR